MKRWIIHTIRFCLVSMGLFTVLTGQSQKGSTKAILAVDGKEFIFKAETVSPATGRTRLLTPGYFLTVSRDSVIADLPFFGRAYSAPSNMSGGGIRFTSTDFQYRSSIDRKNRREITLKPKDVQDVQELTLTVYDNGRADLSVRSNQRQSIYFYGYVSERK